jgi:hypothetical protein
VSKEERISGGDFDCDIAWRWGRTKTVVLSLSFDPDLVLYFRVKEEEETFVFQERKLSKVALSRDNVNVHKKLLGIYLRLHVYDFPYDLVHLERFRAQERQK